MKIKPVADRVTRPAPDKLVTGTCNAEIIALSNADFTIARCLPIIGNYLYLCTPGLTFEFSPEKRL